MKNRHESAEKTKPKYLLCYLFTEVKTVIPKLTVLTCVIFRSNKVRAAVRESYKGGRGVWRRTPSPRRPTRVRGPIARRCGDFTAFFS